MPPSGNDFSHDPIHQGHHEPPHNPHPFHQLAVHQPLHGENHILEHPSPSPTPSPDLNHFLEEPLQSPGRQTTPIPRRTAQFSPEESLTFTYPPFRRSDAENYQGPDDPDDPDDLARQSKIHQRSNEILSSSLPMRQNKKRGPPIVKPVGRVKGGEGPHLKTAMNLEIRHDGEPLRKAHRITTPITNPQVIKLKSDLILTY